MPTPDAPGGIDRRTFMGLCSAAGLARGLPAAPWAGAAPVVLAAQGIQAPQAPPEVTTTDFHRRHPQRFS